MDERTGTLIGEAEVEAFARHGVVCLRGLLDAAWVERMIAAIDRIEHTPGPFRERYSPGDSGIFFSEKFLWTFDPDFRAFVYGSPAAEVAGRLMGATKVNLFYDHLMVKEPGVASPTPWHQDLNYWPAEGWQICSLWTAFDSIDLGNGGLEFVRGSHLGDTRYRPFDFRGKGELETDEFAPLPDIEGHREDYDIVSWDLEPGDAVAFHALVLHGARPNTTSHRRRRALSTRWAGDDMRYARREKTIRLPHDPGLSPGDPLDSELFPVVWRRAAG